MTVMLIALRRRRRRVETGVRPRARADHGAGWCDGSRGAASSLRHRDEALYIIGVWESEERVRTRWASDEFEEVLTSVGFPSPKTAEITILELHATEPPL
jgi:hypothetical protein